MRRNLRLNILLILTLLFTNYSWAQIGLRGNLRPRSTNKTAIIFGNGMFTSIKQAQDNLDYLKAAVVNHRRLEGTVIYDLAYNENEKITDQLLQALEQRIRDSATHFWRVLYNLVPPELDIKDDIKNALALIVWTEFETDPDLRTHVDLYKKLTRECYKIITVAHSQGNFYSNRAYEILFDDHYKYRSPNMRVVSVATPTSYVAHNDGYITLFTDYIIGLVRIFFSDTLATNFNNGGLKNWDLTGHSFQKSYMAINSKSRDHILEEINRGISYTPSACPYYKQCDYIEAVLKDAVRIEAICQNQPDGEINIEMPLKYYVPTQNHRSSLAFNEQPVEEFDESSFSLSLNKHFQETPHYNYSITGHKVYCYEEKPHVPVYGIFSGVHIFDSSDASSLHNATSIRDLMRFGVDGLFAYSREIYMPDHINTDFVFVKRQAETPDRKIIIQQDGKERWPSLRAFPISWDSVNLYPSQKYPPNDNKKSWNFIILSQFDFPADSGAEFTDHYSTEEGFGSDKAWRYMGHGNIAWQYWTSTDDEGSDIPLCMLPLNND